MKRRTVVLGAVLAVAVGVGAWKYYEQLQFERAVQAQVQAALALNREREARRKAEAPLLEAQAKEREKQVATARQWLNRQENVGEARAILEKVLKADRRNVPARIELARFYMITGYINYRNYQPGTLENAIRELRIASQMDPKSVPALVLLGRAYRQHGEPRPAIDALEKAEKIGGEPNPWLYLYWADALMDLGRFPEAEAKLQRVEAALVSKPSAHAQAELHGRYSSLYTLLGRLDDADKHYQAQLALQPRSAWLHGNYSTFLLFERGLPDAAIGEAEKALQIMDYGMGRLALASARYAKWAQLKRKDPARAAQLLAAAKADAPDFSWVMPRAASYVASSPAMQTMVKELVALGVPLDTKDEHGDTGMMLAAYSGRLRSVELLAKMGASLETRDNYGRTALSLAARGGYVDVAKFLHARGASVNAQDVTGKSALYTAVAEGQEPMVRALLAMDADVNRVTATGQTPLMQAAMDGNAPIAELLLSAGASVSAQAGDLRTAADLAEARGHKELAAQLRNGGRKP